MAVPNKLDKGQTMKSQLATTCFVIGSLIGPVIAHAEDSDKDQFRPDWS